jgi:tyramine---L-glutamate ligase
MRLFVHELVCAGGLGNAPDSLRAEGMAMLAAVAVDFAAAGVEVATLLTPDAPEIPGIRCERGPIVDEGRNFDRLIAESDATLVIAPEFDDHLLRRSERVLELGRELLGCSPEAVRLAGDKLALARRWQSLGVPTPTTSLASEEPPDVYPAVLKPRHGAGSIATRRIDRRADWAPVRQALAALMPEFIVQPYHSGRAVSIAFLVICDRKIPLEPAEQILSTDGGLQYLGGRFPLSWQASVRARRLGLRAIEGITGLAGYVGVDLVLGATGGDDVAIEVNPRLTTSYVALRQRCGRNLARMWLDLRERKAIGAVDWSAEPLEFRVAAQAQG